MGSRLRYKHPRNLAAPSLCRLLPAILSSIAVSSVSTSAVAPRPPLNKPTRKHQKMFCCRNQPIPLPPDLSCRFYILSSTASCISTAAPPAPLIGVLGPGWYVPTMYHVMHVVHLSVDALFQSSFHPPAHHRRRPKALLIRSVVKL